MYREIDISICMYIYILPDCCRRMQRVWSFQKAKFAPVLLI